MWCDEQMQNNELEKARDPITGRLCFGMIGNVVENFLDKDVRKEGNKKFFNKKIRKLVNF